MFRVALDTNVVVAAMRSPAGASSALLKIAADGQPLKLLLSVALAIEYQAVCTRSEHLAASGLERDEAWEFVQTIIALAEPVTTHFLWRPQLSDPNDEIVLETAINGRANALVTFNGRDFGAAPGRFGIEVLTPSEMIRRIKI